MRSIKFGLMFVVAIVVVVLAFCRGALVDESVAVKAAETQGFTDVKIVDHAWFAVGYRGCSQNDAARFTIRATNPIGKKVECYVCSGWLLKAATIRTK